MAACGHRSRLHEFRKSLKAPTGPLEFAKFAASYNPHGPIQSNSPGNLTHRDKEHGGSESLHHDALSNDTCSGIVVGTVADVYSCGAGALVLSRDVQLDLAKIYLVLATARKRLAASGKSSSQVQGSGNVILGDAATQDASVATAPGSEADAAKQSLDNMIKKFERYVVICMALAEDCLFNDLPEAECQRTETYVHDTHQSNVPKSVTNFRINPLNYRSLVGGTEPEEGVRIAIGCENLLPMLSWEFYKAATCSDIFMLLCYTLAKGNFEAYRVILDNHQLCLRKHVQENWKVLLSYVPVVCMYKKCREIIEDVFRGESQLSEDACSNALDWTLWRGYVILKTTKCSYYLLLKFLKTMLPMFMGVHTTDEGLRSRLHVLFSFVSLVKQYVLYSNHNIGTSMSLQDLEVNTQLPFDKYLQLRAAEKLQLFIDCIDIPTVCEEECSCDEIYKDKHGIYSSCLQCKTINGVNRLTVFIRLMKVAEEERNSDNQFCVINEGFHLFFHSVKDCANASINDYMEGFYNKFQGNIEPDVFDMLYVLVKAMLVTDFSCKALPVMMRILYNCNTNYNVLSNYFIIKTTVTVLEESMGMSVVNLGKRNEELVALLAGSHLSKLVAGGGLKEHMSVGAPHLSPHYSELVKEIEQANGVLTLNVVLKVLHCQLRFVEALLNLLSLVHILPSGVRHLHISMGELTEALGDSDKTLCLVQRVIIYIMENGASTDDFRNCIYALQDVAAYLNEISLEELHTMFFYTICVSTDNVKYLEAQLGVWLSLSNKDAGQVLEFMRTSLVAAKVALYRLSVKFDVNFAFSRLIADLVQGLPKRLCKLKYLKLPVSLVSLEIHDLLEVYLKVVGMTPDGDIIAHEYNATSLVANVDMGLATMDYDEIKDEFRKLGLLQRVSTVLKSFNSQFQRFAITKSMLKYRFYNSKVELLEDTLGSIAYACSRHSKEVFSGSGVHWILFLLDSVLCGAFNDQSGLVYGFDDTLKRLQLIKTVAVLVLPREMRKDAEDVIDVLIWAFQEGHSRGNLEPRALSKSALSLISVMLFASCYMKAQDFVGLAKLCSEAQKEELPGLTSFITEQICDWQQCRQGEDVGSPALSASRMTLFEVLTGPDCNSELRTETEPYRESNDTVVRACIMKLMSKVNLAKLEVCQNDKMKISFDKLTHRFTGNTASGLLSRALGKAETGLSSIAMKKMQFETLKGKFFTSSKKSADTFNGCFLPVLNFYNTAILSISDYSFYDRNDSYDSDASAKDLMSWRSVSRLELLSLLRMDAHLGVMRLLEMCNFTFNHVFVEYMHQVFHNFNVEYCLRVLDALAVPLKQLGWSQPLFTHLEAIRKFLYNFQSFPSETEVYIGRFISSSQYRVALFSEVAEYVADHIKEFLHIYTYLDALFSCKEFGLESPRMSRVRIDCKELLQALWTDDPVPEEHLEILDSLLMNEYVRVLMKSFEKTFWNRSLEDLMDKFKSVEPDFLQIQEQYFECLLAIHLEQKKKKKIDQPGHWIYWRKLVYRYLVIYPEEIRSFSMLYKPNSMEVIYMLEVVKANIEGFDITEVDNFEVFKRHLARRLTLQNYFVITDAVRRFDVVAAKMLLETVQTQLMPVDREKCFDASRELFEYSVQSAQRW